MKRALTIFLVGWAAFVVALFTGLKQYAGWLRIVEEVLAILLVIYLYGTEQASCVKLPWIMLILAFPVFGVSLYVMIGLNGPTNKMRKRWELFVMEFNLIIAFAIGTVDGGGVREKK